MDASNVVWTHGRLHRSSALALRSFTVREERYEDKGRAAARQQPSLCHSVSPGGPLSCSVTGKGPPKHV
ncbi:hypothetical protein L227DRAFT_80203 [Lentinus tigrinus ALCF2SS1-6]|uniref:Uncharacterized protein n=1 Tax=Lentinus tigrinus ALCF2SS1-6 TaxID=1328759 RepID=A0A5C2SDL1_9APHY|nr:hypothetical protein L227DRAFT_80203 [Lentinus tigrinus ALCF2SS1-6]